MCIRDRGAEAGSIETESINALMGALSDLEDQINEELAASQDNLDSIAAYASPADLGDLDLSGDASLIENELVMVLDNTARTVSKLEVTMGKIDNVLSDSYENLNSGVRSTLSGTAQLLENLTAALQKTQNIKANEQVISDLLDKNWQKLDDELDVYKRQPRGGAFGAHGADPAGRSGNITGGFCVFLSQSSGSCPKSYRNNCKLLLNECGWAFSVKPHHQAKIPGSSKRKTGDFYIYEQLVT